MNLSDRWRGYLMRIRETYLEGWPTEADGSAAPHVLARRQTIRRMLPGRVRCYRHQGHRAVRIELGYRFGFAHRRLTRDAREILDEIREKQTISLTEPGGMVVWIATDASGAPQHPLRLAIEPSMQLLEDDEKVRRFGVLDRCFEGIGYRALRLRVPDGSPDPRMRAVARWRPAVTDFGMATPHDIVGDLEGTRTVLVVPDEVESHVASARALFLNGWNQWELFTLAKREATIALEASLRRVLDETGARTRFANLIEQAGEPAGEELLSVWERRQADRLRDDRNRALHPESVQSVEWISWAFGDLVLAVRLINLMWARRSRSVPREWGWEIPDLSA